jgi:hypothetical protein
MFVRGIAFPGDGVGGPWFRFPHQRRPLLRSLHVHGCHGGLSHFACSVSAGDLAFTPGVWLKGGRAVESWEGANAMGLGHHRPEGRCHEKQCKQKSNEGDLSIF